MPVEINEFVKNLNNRRYDALLKNGSLEAMADVTTPEDWSTLGSILDLFEEDVQEFIILYSDIRDEFGKYRCSVCGMTTKQAQDANYDCIQEC